MDRHTKKQGFVQFQLITWAAIGVVGTLTVVAGYFFIPAVLERGLDALKPAEVREQQEDSRQLLEAYEDLKQRQATNPLLNVSFPKNPNEPLSNPLDPSTPATEVRDDSIDLVESPDLGFEEVIPPATETQGTPVSQPPPPPIAPKTIICGGEGWHTVDTTCLEDAKTTDPADYKHTLNSLCSVRIPDDALLDACYVDCTARGLNLLDSLNCENNCRQIYMWDAFDAKNEIC